jgi:3-hydroxyacyl-CoA dehydrogenase
MGGGIAMNFLNAGIPVKLLETRQEALDKGIATIRKNYENTLKKGKLTQEKLEQRMGLLSSTLAYEDIGRPTSWSKPCSRKWASRKPCSASSTK